MRLVQRVLATIVTCAPVVAFAQATPGSDPDVRAPTSTAPALPAEPLPPVAEAAVDPAPPETPAVVPTIDRAETEPRDEVGFGSIGVREVGAAAGLSLAHDIRAVNFSPSIGWFVSERFEISGLLDVTNLKAGSASATMWSALVEPSYHLPLSREVQAFVGMGVGAAYVSELGGGLAVAPRVGLDVLVGRVGILRPSLQYAYTTHDAMGTVDQNGNTDVALVAISSALRFNIGYSRMW